MDESENFHLKGKDHYTSGLQYDWFILSNLITCKQQHIFFFGQIQ